MKTIVISKRTLNEVIGNNVRLGNFVFTKHEVESRFGRISKVFAKFSKDSEGDLKVVYYDHDGYECHSRPVAFMDALAKGGVNTILCDNAEIVDALKKAYPAIAVIHIG